MKEKVLSVLQEACPDIDFTSTDKLVDDGVLNSLSLTSIISELTMEFGINIPYEEVVAENFNSLESITAMVERLGGLF